MQVILDKTEHRLNQIPLIPRALLAAFQILLWRILLAKAHVTQRDGLAVILSGHIPKLVIRRAADLATTWVPHV